VQKGSADQLLKRTIVRADNETSSVPAVLHLAPHALPVAAAPFAPDEASSIGIGEIAKLVKRRAIELINDKNSTDQSKRICAQVVRNVAGKDKQELLEINSYFEETPDLGPDGYLEYKKWL
jgi:hypothetical protein